MVKKMVTQNKVVKKQVMVEGKFVMKEVTIPAQVEVEVEEMVEETLPDVVVESTTGTECLWVDEHAIEEYTFSEKLHMQGGELIRQIVFGINDGIVTDPPFPLSPIASNPGTLLIIITATAYILLSS